MIVASMEKVIKRYDDLLVLDNVSIELKKGEILGLLGPNGAGKTTLIHSLVGLIKVDSGDITVFNKNQKNNIIEIKKEIGLVTQDLTVFNDLTAKDNLEFFGGLYGLRGSELKNRIKEVLAFVGLTDNANKLPSKFSGGMKRRLNIACALMHKPKLLIMDEPTVGIDPQSRNHILETVKKLRDQGTTILYTTHYMEEIQAIASRVLIMDQGNVIAGGTVDELISNIKYEESVKIDVLEATDQLMEKINKIEGVKETIREGSRLNIISNSDSGNIDRILSVIREHTSIKSVNVDKPTLEDVFLTLTGKTLRDGREG
ncbi:ABC-2 type transport system ATP-binding protein [Natranaerovirga hydrolytica]|uniref:ABC-2 type transport system ATP-binding protein n=1 Tax=Natranaerovirga hydrolytica TaxID=680378 RepID=A0A4R1MKI6_9FIRM|nr:ABC transporter ATP-binding protein [Natranaerovirga hydrolytica]TCK93338.1 ABC-2 type transport system ATP-binding protein [Natranaerovirga hydrolytica]